MTTETTTRNGNKWAKVSGKRGEWSVAKGFKSETKAISMTTVGNKELAMIMARGWVND
jgi:hypothetical protein